MLVFLVFLESLTGVLLKRTKMTKRAKRTNVWMILGIKGEWRPRDAYSRGSSS